MGNHTAGRLIVDRAIQLWLLKPDMPALDILDKAALGNENCDAEFESADPMNPALVHPLYDDERYLPSPFGEILRKAFAPDLDPREMLFATQQDNADAQTQSRIEFALDTWESRVLRPFRIRYGLW